MCRGTEVCTVLGDDRSHWSKECPLPLPSFFHDALNSFKDAVIYLVDGNYQESLRSLAESNADSVGSFFIEHGQQSAYFRVQNRVDVDTANRLAKEINESPRLIPKIEEKVFIRDSYRCRYCGMRIIAKDVFKEFSRIVGSEIFSVQRENSKRNGLTLGLRGVADHVAPYASGGVTELDNLVTSCYSCNFGKAGYTLEQLGIEDPRLRIPISDEWLGLTEYLPLLRKMKDK